VIQKTRPQSHEQKIERATAAADRLRGRLAENAPDSEIDIAHAPLSWWRARWADPAIRRQFIENFIYVRDAFDENKLVRLKFNDLQAHAHENDAPKVARIKGRRAGSSKAAQAKVFANAVVNSGRRVRAVPHDPDTEEEIRTDFKIMYENLLPHLRPLTRYYRDDLISFHDPAKGTVDSEIRTSTVQPGREGKGRGLGITDLWMPEAAHYLGDQRKAAAALIQAASGGEVTVDTTPYGIDWVFKIYQQGKKRQGGWVSQCYEWWWTRHYRIEGTRFRKARGKWILLGPNETLKDVWRVLPARATQTQRADARASFEAAVVTPEEIVAALRIKAHLLRMGYLAQKNKGAKTKWQFDEIAEYIAWRRAKIQDIGEADFKVEYLENDSDCFENTGRPVVSPVFLKNPSEPSEPIEGHEYIIGVDSSLGRAGGNPSAIVVIDVNLGQVVHSEKERRSPDQLAYRTGELSDHYNDAYIVPESNNTGYAVIDALCTQGYGEVDRLYRHLDAAAMRRLNDPNSDTTLDEELAKAPFGFPTTFKGYASKSTAAQMLEESIRKAWLQVDQAFIDEARVVVWSDNETFGPLPGQDHHADLFMATMIANFVMRIRPSLSGGFIGVLPEVGYAR
jgi:hypothetical protein